MESRYISWVRMLEEGLRIKYRDNVRNHDERDPVFGIDSIPVRTSEDGFGIQAVRDKELDRNLSNYASHNGVIKLDFNQRQFRLTRFGKSLMVQMDPQID